MTKLALSALALLLASLPAGTARADDAPSPYNARLVQPAAAEERITGLDWDSEELDVSPDEAGQNPSVVLRAKFETDGRILLGNDQQLCSADDVEPEKEIALTVRLIGPETPLRLVAVTQLGELKQEKVTVSFPGWDAYWNRQKNPPPPKPYVINAGAGVSSISYQEQLAPSLSEITLTGKASFQYELVPRKWDLSLSGYLTLLPLASNLPDVDFRFLGLNARAGYILQGLPEPWRLTLMGGFYYTTTFVKNAQMGFTGMSGPQIYPVLRRALAGGRVAYGYLKYSPILNGMSLSFSSSEIAIGGGWIRPLRDGRTFSITLDLARLNLDIEDVLEATSTSFTLGIGLGW